MAGAAPQASPFAPPGPGEQAPSPFAPPGPGGQAPSPFAPPGPGGQASSPFAPPGPGGQASSPYAPPGPGGQAPSPYAPPGPGAPAPAPYAPPGPGGPGYGVPMGAMPPAGWRSSKGLAIGLVVGAVAVTGIIIAVVVATSGGGGGGAGSRDDLVKRTLAAMSNGDVDKLVKLSDPEGLNKKALDCSERDEAKQATGDDDVKATGDDDVRDKAAGADSDDDDVAMQAKRVRRRHEKLVEGLNGMKLELVSIDGKRDQKQGDAEDDDQGKTKKGSKAGTGCVFKTDVRMHELTATVRVTAGEGEPAEQEVKLGALEVDGSWYLASPPTIRAGAGSLAGGLEKYRDRMCACKDTACGAEVQNDYRDWKKSQRDAVEKLSRADRRPLDDIDDELKACRRKLREGDPDRLAREAIAKMEELKTQMCRCTDKPCADRVNQAMQDWVTSMASKAVKPTRTEDMAKLTEIAQELGTCMMKAMTPAQDPAPPDEPAPPDDPTSGGGTSMASPPGCDAYRRQIDKLRACPRYSPVAADSLRRSLEQMERSWSRTTDAAARQQVNRHCQGMADSLKKSIDRICP